jgi:glycosyltransferase involved in cell wall biosynthesis
MRVLHLFSNSKWTGPAEPALNLVVALRRLGVDADFACAPDAGDSINKVVETARDRDVPPILRFHLHKHNHPIKNWSDRRALTAYLRSTPYDLIHCHLDNDHRIARGPAEKLGIPLVRSSYHGAGFQPPAKFAKLLAGVDRLIEPSQLALDHDQQAFGMKADRLSVVPGAVDVERFDARRELPDGRSWLNVPHDAFVVGIVARMQTHRRYEDFWGAVQRLASTQPKAHVIVIGRGTNQDKVGMGPVRDAGLEDRVHFSGYIEGENYVGMLKALDCKVLLVPGSDGTCRAVREAMAMGKPAIVADRGMLSEIVTDGEDGYVVDGTPDSLFNAFDRLAGNRALTHRLGQAARAKAESTYSLEAQAKAVSSVYEEILA